MPIFSWCPKGCYIANHHVWVPERNKEEEEEETQQISTYISLANSITWPPADFKED